MDLNNLSGYIIDFITKPSVVYFGIGSNFIPSQFISERHKWNFGENQQFPPFINDLTKKYLGEIQILIILIDPSFTDDSPYIINDSDIFLGNSWKCCKDYENVFISELDVHVIYLSKFITWGVYKENEESYYDIEPLLINLCQIISQKEIDSLLFYHEFTGKNVILLENDIKKKTNYDNTKICIDITRGTNLSCYFNLSTPENYPIISRKERLKYINPEYLDQEQKILIIKEYKKFTYNYFLKKENYCETCIFSKNNPNFLFDKPDNLILCFQLIQNDLNNISLIIDDLIPLIRQFNLFDNTNYVGSNLYHITSLKYLKFKFNFIDIDVLIHNYELLNNINKSNIQDYKMIFNNIKTHLLDELFQILKLVLYDLLFKYSILQNEIDEFVDNKLKCLPDKYKLVCEFKSYIYSVLNA